jgi:hypothetical protein
MRSGSRTPFIYIPPIAPIPSNHCLRCLTVSTILSRFPYNWQFGWPLSGTTHEHSAYHRWTLQLVFRSYITIHEESYLRFSHNSKPTPQLNLSFQLNFLHDIEDEESGSLESRDTLRREYIKIIPVTGRVGASTSHNPIGLHALLRKYLYFMETECASCEVRTGL